MGIMEQMVVDMLSRGEVMLTLSPETAAQVESKAVKALERIRSILADHELDDPECFERIEQIVCAFEDIGIDCGARHDFG